MVCHDLPVQKLPAECVLHPGREPIQEQLAPGQCIDKHIPDILSVLPDRMPPCEATVSIRRRMRKRFADVTLQFGSAE